MTDVVQDGTHIVNSNIVKVTISNNCKLITFFELKKECFTINLFHLSRSRPTSNKHVCHSNYLGHHLGFFSLREVVTYTSF